MKRPTPPPTHPPGGMREPSRKANPLRGSGTAQSVRVRASNSKKHDSAKADQGGGTARGGRPRKTPPGVELPIFDSIAACSNATGIPVATIRWAKRNGCPAFRSSRVYLGELLPWLFGRKEAGETGKWQDALIEAKAKRERIRLDRDEGRVIDRDFVKTGIQKGVAILFSALDRHFLNELPPALKGLDEVAIRDRSRAQIERMKAECRKQFETAFQEEES